MNLYRVVASKGRYIAYLSLVPANSAREAIKTAKVFAISNNVVGARWRAAPRETNREDTDSQYTK